MLISYPVLPASAVNDDEDEYFKNILNGYVIDNEGTFPISRLPTPAGPMYRWHGGIHMRGNGEPIRAIADGTVVAYRFAQKRETYEGQGEYDTSFVLIRHETESGENTKVSFYSLYMHLTCRDALLADRYAQLPDWMKQAGTSDAVRKPNKKIWRKDVLGFAGQLYGRETWHFEVFATDADLDAFWRDSLFIHEGSGSADFFGDAHFVIPAGSTFRVRHPRAAAQGAHAIHFANGTFPLTVGSDGTNNETLYVSVRFHKGQRIASTRVRDAEGRYVLLKPESGDGLVRQADYEYELFRLATALYPDCPSAGYEWLRFGRVLGPDTTTHQENWQLVRFGREQIGYVDLAPNTVVKLSDADFPFWLGWEKRSQGSAASLNDGICRDEALIKTYCESGDYGKELLRHLVCKHPSEWDGSDLAQRYAGLREPGQPLHEGERWSKFEQHVKKLTFWSDAGLAERSVWHFHPLEFVRNFRNCGWLSTAELVSTFPRHMFYSEHGNPRVAITTPGQTYTLSASQAGSRIAAHANALNACLRKYIGPCKRRQAIFLAQVLLESAQWRDLGGSRRLLHEWGFGAYSPANPATQFYSAFYGRGILQLTWAGNYRDYGAYRALLEHEGGYVERLPNHAPRITSTSQHWSGNPNDGGAQFQWSPRFDPDIVGEQPYEACDSGGFYWISKRFSAGYNINRVADRPFSVDNIGFVNRLVNGGGNGYYERQAYTAFMSRILGDNVADELEILLTLPAPKAAVRVNMGMVV